jgi:hypothetical protein
MYDELENCYTHPKYGSVSVEKIKKILSNEDNVLKGNEAACAALNIKIFANEYLRNDLEDVDYYNLLISIGSVIRSSDTGYRLLKTSIVCLMLCSRKSSEGVINVILNGGGLQSLESKGRNSTYFPDPCTTVIFHKQKGICTTLFKMLMMLGLDISSKFIGIMIHRIYNPDYDPFTVRKYERAFVDLVLHAMRQGFVIEGIDRNNFEDGFVCSRDELISRNRPRGIASSYSINNIIWDDDGKCTFCEDTSLNVIGSDYISHKCYVKLENASRLCSRCYFYEQLIKIENIYKKEVGLVDILQLFLGIKT